MSMQASDLVIPDVALWAMRHRLTLQQAIFVEAYRQDFDPVKALHIAGFVGRDKKALAMKLLKPFCFNLRHILQPERSSSTRPG